MRSSVLMSGLLWSAVAAITVGQTNTELETQQGWQACFVVFDSKCFELLEAVPANARTVMLKESDRDKVSVLDARGWSLRHAQGFFYCCHDDAPLAALYAERFRSHGVPVFELKVDARRPGWRNKPKLGGPMSLACDVFLGNAFP